MRPSKKQNRLFTLLVPLVLLASFSCIEGPRTHVSKVSSPDPAPTQILWDTWGVPHIWARNEAELFYAFGWAQMESHGDILLEDYGIARGRAAEYWGEKYLESDQWVQVNDIPARGGRWYEAQSPEMRRDLDAFAAGVNDYAAAHGDRLDPTLLVVLPVRGRDVLAHINHLIHFTFASSQRTVRQQLRGQMRAGSNGWVIAPRRSEDGHSMLLMNPHLTWHKDRLWYEAQLSAPGFSAYGATLVGFPILALAFNDHLGWTHTINTIDIQDIYRLHLAPGGYRWDGAVRPFESERRTLKVKQADGSQREVPLTILRSVHGPVVFHQGNTAFALRVAGLDESGFVQEYFDMARARSMTEFVAALKRLQVPMFTVLYADRDGHILYLFGGRVPKRAEGDWSFWSGIIPGDTSKTLWTSTLPYEALPKVVDPPTGWLQNSNDPPWLATYPATLKASDFPPYLAPSDKTELRAQEAIKLLSNDPEISFDELVSYKESTHVEVADRLLPDLLAAARSSDSEVDHRAAQVLESWDRRVDATSRGAVLFDAFLQTLVRRRRPGQTTSFASPYDPAHPLTTPTGLVEPPESLAKTLEIAAQQVEKAYGRLDVPWGEVHRLRRDNVDLPASGGPNYMGVLEVLGFAPTEDHRFQAEGGETFTAAVDFGSPVRARALLAYGNASQPGSPHRTDQLPLLAKKQLRPVWLQRSEVEAHLESREALHPSPTIAGGGSQQ